MHHFVVTGSGRSGTTYAARLFTALGVECGHEAVFRVDTSRFTGFGPYVGDASWLAVPFVASLPDDVRVIHLVRNPLLTIASQSGYGFLRAENSAGDYARALRRWVARARWQHRLLPRQPLRLWPFRDFVREHTPEVFDEPDPLARIARHWLTWNLLLEQQLEAPERTWRRIQLEQLDAAAVTELLAMLEVSPAEDPAEVLAALPRDINQRGQTPQLGWSDVPSSVRDEVRRLADRYGYPTT